MGRKKTENSPKNYFDEPEELAVVEYLFGDPANKEKIYNDKLHKPFNKMIESLIKRYRLMRDDISIEDLINETLAHVILKFDKFDPGENKKAYSYYGTVAVNYLKAQLIKYSKNKNRYLSYEDISSDLEENERYTYEIEIDKGVETYDFIPIVIFKLEEEINTNEKLKPNDIKVGLSVIDLLKNWEIFIDPEDQSSMFNRNKILYYIRENSQLTSKEVRNSLKKFKILYQLIKSETYE